VEVNGQNERWRMLKDDVKGWVWLKMVCGMATC